MGATALKKLCREQGLSRWPFRRRQAQQRSNCQHIPKLATHLRPCHTAPPATGEVIRTALIPQYVLSFSA